MDPNSRAWIVSRNRISHEYTLGLNNFLATARHHLDSDGRTLCPCNRCENTWLQRIPTIRAHILRHESPYHETNTLSSMFVASENDIDDVTLVRNDVQPMNCDEDKFMNDDDEDNESEDVEPTYESEDKEASEEDEDDGVN
ncbi:hypothetical protein L6452_40778 [Arctium lappa]|uniref:Uncharacterized protein n=1 Tax=Arctium lappa TaxID=4217 RepID=A0ACB8XN28_ARCLA|nr:hypothetical protein L6452_40778 [Arctium lappa]